MALARTCVEGGWVGGGVVMAISREAGTVAQGFGWALLSYCRCWGVSKYPVSARLWMCSSMVSAGSPTPWGNCGVEVEVSEVEQSPTGAG